MHLTAITQNKQYVPGLHASPELPQIPIEFLLDSSWIPIGFLSILQYYRSLVWCRPCVVQTQPCIVETQPCMVQTQPCVIQTQPSMVQTQPSMVWIQPCVFQAQPCVVQCVAVLSVASVLRYSR